MSGTIVKKREGVWMVRIFVGRNERGVTQYFNKTIRGTKKDAQKFLTAKLREKDLGLFVEPALISVNEFLDDWIDKVARIKVRPVTLDGYEAKLRSYVRDTIGHKRLCDLHSYDIQSLYNGMIRRGLSAKTVRHVHNVLAPALKQAVKWKMISTNPCEHCELPKLAKREMRCLTPQQAAIFLQTSREDAYFAAFVLAIETGMRPEEYLGLQWKDVDFDQNRLIVRRAVVIRKVGGFYFSELKTDQSRRTIPLSKSAVSALKIHRKSQLEHKMAILDVYEDHDLVFPTQIGTPTLCGNLDKRHFKKILELAGLPKIRLYDLRHTMATLLLLQGINPKIVSERLGHSSIALTLDTYSHVLPTMQKEATDQIEKVLYGT